MTPLFVDHIKNAGREIDKHHLILLIIRSRPEGWSEIVWKYIDDVNKNSFYLQDVYDNLKVEYRYCIASDRTLRTISDLIKRCGLKHHRGISSPSRKDISKIGNADIPSREDAAL